jgi:hypothetical protein
MGAVVLGMYLRRVLPEHYLSADTKDAVKLAMGLVATMSALVLGLLVTSVKGAYDTRRGEVIQMAAKVAYIDRVLKAYGPEADEVPVNSARWSRKTPGDCGRGWMTFPPSFALTNRAKLPSLSPSSSSGSLRVTIPAHPRDAGDDPRHGIWAAPLNADCPVGGLHFKADAHRGDLLAHAHLPEFQPARPPKPTATVALVASTLSVADAILLILEMDLPFEGMIRISSEPMLRAISHLAASFQTNGQHLSWISDNSPNRPVALSRRVRAGEFRSD